MKILMLPLVVMILAGCSDEPPLCPPYAGSFEDMRKYFLECMELSKDIDGGDTEIEDVIRECRIHGEVMANKKELRACLDARNKKLLNNT